MPVKSSPPREAKFVVKDYIFARVEVLPTSLNDKSFDELISVIGNQHIKKTVNAGTDKEVEEFFSLPTYYVSKSPRQTTECEIDFIKSLVPCIVKRNIIIAFDSKYISTIEGFRHELFPAIESTAQLSHFRALMFETSLLDSSKLIPLDDELLESFIQSSNCTSDEMRRFASCQGRGMSSVIFDKVQEQYAFYINPYGTVKPPSLLDKLRKTHTPPTIEDDGFCVDIDIWNLLCRNNYQNVNSLIYGESGTGKTTLLRKLAKSAWYDFKEQPMNGIVDGVSSLIGKERLIIDAKGNQVSHFDYAPLVTWLQREDGLIINFDEVNRPPIEVTNMLLSLLDDRREFSLELAAAEQSRTIKVGDNISFFATANLGNSYVGTKEIDQAIQERFVFVELLPLSKEQESALLVKLYGISKAHADCIANVSCAIRETKNAGEISKATSIRHSKAVASYIKDGADIKQALTSLILPYYQGGSDGGERVVVETLIKSYTY